MLTTTSWKANLVYQYPSCIWISRFCCHSLKGLISHYVTSNLCNYSSLPILIPRTLLAPLTTIYPCQFRPPQKFPQTLLATHVLRYSSRCLSYLMMLVTPTYTFSHSYEFKMLPVADADSHHVASIYFSLLALNHTILLSSSKSIHRAGADSHNVASIHLSLLVLKINSPCWLTPITLLAYPCPCGCWIILYINSLCRCWSP